MKENLFALYNKDFLQELKTWAMNQSNWKNEIALIDTRIRLVNQIREMSPSLVERVNEKVETSIFNQFTDKYLEKIKENLKVPKQTISAVIIALNEERCIKRCIKSVIDIVDEIILVDTGSTDDTLKITQSIKSNKIKTYNFEWTDSFSEARNFATDKATSDWVFHIDADEYIADEDPQDIRFIIEMLYQFPLRDSIILCPSITNHNEHNLINVKRIFFKKSNIQFFGLVHEDPRKEIKLQGQDVYYIAVDIKINHDGYTDQTIKEKSKISRNFSLLQKMIKIEPENPRWKFFLVREGFNILKPSDIERLIKEALLLKTEEDIITFDKLNIHEYTFALINVLTDLKLRQGEFNEVNRLSDLLNKLIPCNSNSVYFSMMSKISKYKLEMSTMLKDTIEYREKHFDIQPGMLHSHGYHIDYIIAILLFETGMYDKSIKYVHFLKDKFAEKDLERMIHLLQMALKENDDFIEHKKDDKNE